MTRAEIRHLSLRDRELYWKRSDQPTAARSNRRSVRSRFAEYGIPRESFERLRRSGPSDEEVIALGLPIDRINTDRVVHGVVVERGRKRYRSRGGLIWYRNSLAEIFRHYRNSSWARARGVWTIPPAKVVAAADDAYRTVRAALTNGATGEDAPLNELLVDPTGSSRLNDGSGVRIVTTNGEKETLGFQVNLNVVVGRLGGQAGRRAGHPRLRAITLILNVTADPPHVVTVYPVERSRH